MITRIVDNAHLLDATEIFRKLNVHKKVRHSVGKAVVIRMNANDWATTGIIHQARLPSRHVLLLPLLDDSCKFTSHIKMYSR